MLKSFLDNTINDINSSGIRRKLYTVEGSQGRSIIVRGKEVLNFCSNNYLGLADDSRLSDAAISCIRKDGVGAGASRLVCGNFDSHELLEEKIAQFKGTESCLVFSSGYMANVGIISSLFNRDDIIFSDRLNHASIVDGILLSKATLKRYPHLDMEALERYLKQAQGYKKKVIITDSVFSMDGDIAPLDKIVKLSDMYGCCVMVDEAHAVGVLGSNGRGAVEYFGVEGKIDIQMGTLSKAVGSYGAYVCGSSQLKEFFLNKARSFIYTTGIPPGVAAASYKGIEIIEQDLSLRKQLWENTHYMQSELRRMNFNILNTQTPIIPIVLGEPDLAVEFSKKLFDKGIFLSAIRPPTVPYKTARLRLTVMATHKNEDLNYTLEQLKNIGKELCII